ncbi:MAG: sulfite exporter TauE/SafE family protein [Flavobacteriaceae bacterium]|nr:sulfite exporter TauE/SafE family protein [Flavobacteriaceae bacterium]
MEVHLLLDVFTSQWLVIGLFFCIAILYSSVGFGGGSSYLAVLALIGLGFTEIRATALLCNILVVSSNVFFYMKNNDYPWKKVLPLVLFSVPFAFIGGLLKINQMVFFVLLGFTLLFAAITMWLSKKIAQSNTENNEIHFLKNSAYGSSIGFVSGMVGIGGGIFLAPLLHLSHWDTPKKIAATASFFILVNSLAGLSGQLINPDFYVDWNLTSILLITVFIGGQIGSRLSNKLFSAVQLKKATAILIAFVSIRILIKYLF